MVALHMAYDDIRSITAHRLASRLLSIQRRLDSSKRPANATSALSCLPQVDARMTASGPSRKRTARQRRFVHRGDADTTSTWCGCRELTQLRHPGGYRLGLIRSSTLTG